MLPIEAVHLHYPVVPYDKATISTDGLGLGRLIDGPTDRLAISSWSYIWKREV